MARPSPPARAATTPSSPDALTASPPATLTSSTAVYRSRGRTDHKIDRRSIAKPWQREAYDHVNKCGEARYSAALFANMAARAELGVSEGNALGRKAVWVNSGPEVATLAELAPTVRERKKLIRDYMVHFIIAGECYLIARDRQENDPDPHLKTPVWEVVAVTELQKNGDTWRVRYDNEHYIDLAPDDPVIRMWNADPENRREAWSPFRSLLPTLREIDWLTKHIFTQVRSRLMSAGVWFLPDNLTFAPPPAEAVEGGDEAIARMNEAEQFMASLAAASMALLDSDEVALPSVIMADSAAMAEISQEKLIKFWSEIDDKAMILRSDAVRRFALGMDLPPEQVLGSSGLAVTGAGGSAGSVNHWGVWANEEQTISNHIEPALDTLVSALTVSVLRADITDTTLVVAYDTASLRLRQDRSKEAMEWYDRGILKATVALRETGFDPENDMMSDKEHRTWLLNRIVSGSATPEQMQAAFFLLTNSQLPVESPVSGNEEPAPRTPGRNDTPSLEDHPYEGPPREQHDHSDAPFSARVASCEGLVLRALEKAGNRLLNDGKRGRDKDRTTPPLLAHITASAAASAKPEDFDFATAPLVFQGLTASDLEKRTRTLASFCADLHQSREPYSRERLRTALEGI